MINLNDYARHEEIKELCDKIQIPEHLAQKALVHIGDEKYAAAAPFFGGLFCNEDAEASVKSIIESHNGPDGELIDSGFGVMAIFLSAALRIKEDYERLGIDPFVYYDTMSFFNQVLNENLLLYGKYTFDRAWWYRRQIAGIIYKLGVLEFEKKSLGPSEAEIYGLKEGSDVLSVHIQSGANLAREMLDDSYDAARKFFSRYFPDIDYVAFICDSWLLSPALRSLLPANSRIAIFQSDYEIVKVSEATEYFYPYLYKLREKPADLNDLPEDTSLRRAVKRHIIGGGKIGSASGIIRM